MVLRADVGPHAVEQSSPEKEGARRVAGMKRGEHDIACFDASGACALGACASVDVIRPRVRTPLTQSSTHATHSTRGQSRRARPWAIMTTGVSPGQEHRSPSDRPFHQEPAPASATEKSQAPLPHSSYPCRPDRWNQLPSITTSSLYYSHTGASQVEAAQSVRFCL
jgi:hypothetical protein